MILMKEQESKVAACELLGEREGEVKEKRDIMMNRKMKLKGTRSEKRNLKWNSLVVINQRLIRRSLILIPSACLHSAEIIMVCQEKQQVKSQELAAASEVDEIRRESHPKIASPTESHYNVDDDDDESSRAREPNIEQLAKWPRPLLFTVILLLLASFSPLFEVVQARPEKRSEVGEPPEEGRASSLGGVSPWSLPNRPSLFSIIRFPNDECFDSSNQSGTCYTAFECRLLGGQPSSPCAAGFGACCIVSRSCHVSTRERVVYFKNPSYPSADSDEKFCDLTVELVEPSVCQLRIDFLDFQLDPPTEGACANDYMELSASGVPPETVPRLCGLNRNQHLYISIPQGSHAERSVSIVFYTDPVGDHRWQLKVTQVDCLQRANEWKHSIAHKWSSSPLWAPHPNLRLSGSGIGGGGRYSTTLASGFQTLGQAASALANELLRPQFTPRAPIGCLQYFTQPSGIVESFNFGHYLNNLDYSICLQRAPDTCRVVFTSSDYDWSLNGVGVSGAASGVGDQDCARDYLLIPGGSRTGDGFTYDRYCGARLHYFRGQSLSAPIVTKSAGPLVLRFHSDAHHESLNNGGFRLQYEQSGQDCAHHTAEEAGALAPQQLLASSLSDSQPMQQVEPPIYSSSRLSAPPELQDSPKSPARRSDSQAGQLWAAPQNEVPDVQATNSVMIPGRFRDEQLARRLAQAFQLITSRL